MLFLALLLSAQAPAATDYGQKLDAAVARAQPVTNQIFDCMDKQTKIEMKAHMLDMTPEMVVDSALKSCGYLKPDLTRAFADPDLPISNKAGLNIADKYFVSIRDPYIKNVEDLMVRPDFAKLRMDVALMRWRKCVSEHAINWSRLKDDASTIAQAALTACNSDKQNVIISAGFVLRSKGLPAGKAAGMIDTVQDAMKDIAVEAIISERAKRLPKRP